MPPLEEESFNLEAALLSGEDTQSDDSGSPVKPTDNNYRDTMSRGDVDKSADDVSPETEDDAESVADDESATDDATDAPEVEQPETDAADDDADVFARAATFGLDLKGKYKTKGEAIDGLLNAARLVGQRSHEAAYGKQLLENPKAVLESLLKVYGAPTPEAKPEPEAKKTDIPEYDPAWREMLDDEGKPLPGVDPSIPIKLRKYADFIRTRAENLARDPEAVLEPLLKGKIEKMVDERAKAIVKEESDRLRQEQYHVEVRRNAESLVQEEASWAFVDGDLRKGPTAEGKVLGKWLQILEQPDEYGNSPIPNMRMRKEVAVMMARQELGAVQKKDDASVRKQKQEKITKKPNRSPNEPTDRSWPKGLTLEEALSRAVDKQ